MKNQSLKKENASEVCPKTGKSIQNKRHYRWLKWLFPVTGLFALIWFLIRVIPKPSRATYPCQRIVFPLASSFVVWLTGAVCSVAAFRKAKYYFVRSRYVIACLCIVVSMAAAFFTISIGNEKTVMAADPTPNVPIGIAKGANPGRVVWVHDANSTDWDGPGMGDGFWWESDNTDMAAVDRMMTRTIRSLAGESDISQAWDKLFRYFNQTHDKGDVGYQAGEKITIKVNLVGCYAGSGFGGVHPFTYDLDPHWSWEDMRNYMNTSPQMMLALLRQLVPAVGICKAAPVNSGTRPHNLCSGMLCISALGVQVIYIREFVMENIIILIRKTTCSVTNRYVGFIYTNDLDQLPQQSKHHLR